MAKAEQHTRAYTVYCGNYDCPSRLAGKTFVVTEGHDLIDGEIWMCELCRQTTVDVRTEIV